MAVAMATAPAHSVQAGRPVASARDRSMGGDTEENRPRRRANAGDMEETKRKR